MREKVVMGKIVANDEDPHWHPLLGNRWIISISVAPTVIALALATSGLNLYVYILVLSFTVWSLLTLYKFIILVPSWSTKVAFLIYFMFVGVQVLGLLWIL